MSWIMAQVLRIAAIAGTRDDTGRYLHIQPGAYCYGNKCGICALLRAADELESQ